MFVDASLTYCSTATNTYSLRLSPALAAIGFLGMLFGARGELFPKTLEVSSLNASDGILINPVDTRGFGNAFTAGDFDNDTFSDLAICSSGFQKKIYVIFGGPSVGASGSLNLTTLQSPQGFIFQPDSGVYGCEASAGDLNGDGIKDLVVACDGEKAHVIFGGSQLRSLSALSPAMLTGANGFSLTGRTNSVASGKDVNGDGIDDCVLGSENQTPSNGIRYAGVAYVVFGGHDIGKTGNLDLANLNGQNGLILNGEQDSSHFGKSVAMGDLNGDGIADIAVGAWVFSPVPNVVRYSGRFYVFFGTSNLNPQSVEASSLVGSNGFAVNGAQDNDGYGYAVAIAPDVNGDGIVDLLVSTRSRGKVTLLFGSKSFTQATYELANLGSRGQTWIVGSGRSPVSGLGDINGDGVGDFAIGYPEYGLDPKRRAGRTLVVFGTSVGQLNLEQLDGSNGFYVDGSTGGGLLGSAVGPALDLNGDGVNDLVIGSTENDDLGLRFLGSGNTYVVFGKAPPRTSSSASTTAPSSSQMQLPLSLSGSTGLISATSGTTYPPTTTLEIREEPTDEHPFPTGGVVGGILGGLCAVASAVGLAIFCFQRRKSESEEVATPYPAANETLSDTNHTYQIPVRESHYTNPLPDDGSHYVPLSEVNRAHEEYESARFLRLQNSYDDIPQF